MPKKERSYKLNNYHSLLNLNNLVRFFSRNDGFTLIEILVAITLFVIIIGGVFFALNPFKQIEKGQDAQRHQDLQQIKNAIETYYQDNSCYPQEIPFGQEWSSGETVYMKSVPQDPTCGNDGGSCYQYLTDFEAENSCAQWNVVFAKLSTDAFGNASCPLSTLSDTCVPEGYDENWSCVLSGAVQCSLLAQSGFSYDSGNIEVSPSTTPNATATPTPTGPQPTISLSPNSSYRILGGQSSKNPYMSRIDVDPWWALPDTAQTFMLTVADSTSDVTEAKVHLFSDSGSQILTLNLNSGTVRNGTWAGTISADTYNSTYAMALVAKNANGVDHCAVVTNGGRNGGTNANAICTAINNN